MSSATKESAGYMEKKKPKFDPDKPFEVADDEPVKQKPKFDPSQPFDVAQESSDEEPSVIKELGAKALGKVAEAAEWFDARTGAPARKAIGVLQEDFTDLPEAWEAAKTQYGAPTALAPTGKQLATRAGVSTTALSEVLPELFSETGEEWTKFRKGGFADVSPAGVAGLGLDISADPTNILPVGAIAKGVKAGVSAGAKGTVAGAKELAGFIRSMKPVAKAVPEAVKVVSEPGVYQTAKGIVKDTAQAVEKLIKPGVSAGWDRYRQIAVKNGIDPEFVAGGALEFGPGSLITRSKQKLAQGIGGEAYRNKYMKGLASIYDATGKVVNKIGDNVAPLSKTDAGEMLATEFKNTSKQFFEKMDITYNTVLSQVPPNAPMPNEALKAYRQSITPTLSKLKARAQNKFLDPSLRLKAKKLYDDLSKVTKAKGTMQELRQSMMELQDAFTTPYLAKDMPLETKALRDLYSASSDAYIKGTREYLGNEVADALVDNNKAMTEWFKTSERLDDLVSSGKSGEEIFRKVIESGDSQLLRQTKEVFSDNPGVLKRAKAALLDSLMRPDDDGVFSFARFNNKIRDPKTKMLLKELFEPDEVIELLELTKMGEDMGPQILNPSRTAEFLGLELSPKNIASEMAQRGIVETLERGARKRGVLEGGAQLPPQLPPPETLSTPFADNLKYGAAFSAGAEGLGKLLTDPRQIAAKEVLRQTGRLPEEESIDVPPDYLPQLEKDVMSRGRMSNTEKALILLKAKREGKISLEVLNRIQEGR